MGTNYYAIVNNCDHCKRHDKLHIGKKSGGWKFSFHGDTELGLRSWEDWKKFLVDKVIKDEYDEVVDSAWFVSMVNRSKDEKLNHLQYCLDSDIHGDRARKNIASGIEWFDEDGWSFCTEYFS